MESYNKSEFCAPQPHTHCRRLVLSYYHAVLFNCVVFFLSGVTVALNTLIIISISHFRQLHTPTNFLLLSLAVSDFFVGLLLMPTVPILRTTCWAFGDLACSLLIYLSFIITSASVGEMVLISIDRYVAICYPLHYANSVTVKKVQICLCWLCSIAYCSVYAQFHKICYGECFIVLDRVVGMFDVTLTFIVPVTSIVVLYMRVFVVAVSQARAMRRQAATHSIQGSVTVKPKRSEMKAARTLGVVIVTFLQCFCPYYGVNLAELSTVSYLTSLYVFYLNSCLNPIIYSMFYPWCRKAIKLIVTFQMLQPGSSKANVMD